MYHNPISDWCWSWIKLIQYIIYLHTMDLRLGSQMLLLQKAIHFEYTDNFYSHHNFAWSQLEWFLLWHEGIVRLFQWNDSVDGDKQLKRLAMVRSNSMGAENKNVESNECRFHLTNSLPGSPVSDSFCSNNNEFGDF